ncbi:hypothetical protein [Nonomuraea sp. NPDC049504]|uniref:hypothetical protein n=1 Tax=Nonomuraea sp. NPDC049504 TaxID=3154729 RepID=UPI00342AFFA4
MGVAETPSADAGGDRGSPRWTNLLVGLGSIADLAAVAQLVTSGARQWILVAGLLAVLAGVLGLIQLVGQPIGRRAMVMVVLVGTGAGVTGAMIGQFFGESPEAEKYPAAAGSPGPSGAGGTPSPGTGSASGPAAAATAGAVASVASGQVLRQGAASLKDQDYLDAETGKIGEVRPGASDVVYVGPYRELWTAGGGALPITPVEGRPDAAACAAALQVRDYDMVVIGDMKAGAWACARTVEDNLLAVQIRAVPEGDVPLEIAYTVWQK